MLFPKRGVYTIILELPKSVTLRVGSLKAESFKAGFYCYIGSALGGLRKRLARHFSDKKKIHWHIDYLLNEATIIKAIFAQTNTKKECQIADELSATLTLIPRFGCSDCKCKSHLFFCNSLEELEVSVIDCFGSLDLKPLKLEDAAGFSKIIS